MKKLKVFIFALLLVSIFNIDVLAFSEKLNASSTNGESKTFQEQEKKKETVSKPVTGYKVIPDYIKTVINKEVSGYFPVIERAKKKGQTASPITNKEVGQYAFYIASHTEPEKSVSWIDFIIKSQKTVTMDSKSVVYFGRYLLTVRDANSIKTTIKNLRTKEFYWDIKNTTTGKVWPQRKTSGNSITVTFDEAGTYHIKAQEILEYDVMMSYLASVSVKCSHTAETATSYTSTGPQMFKEKGTKNGLETTWVITIPTEDIGKPITIPGHIDQEEGEIEVFYELVE